MWKRMIGFLLAITLLLNLPLAALATEVEGVALPDEWETEYDESLPEEDQEDFQEELWSEEGSWEGFDDEPMTVDDGIATYASGLNSWTKTDNICDNMINAALAQVGKKNADFGDADGMPADHWCAYFMIWCSRVSGAGSAGLLPKQYSGYGTTGALAGKACSLGKSTLTCFDTTAYNHMVSNYGTTNKQTGTRSSFSYQAGDLIFFKWTGGTAKFASHVGLIYKVSGTTIYYVDGNGSATSGDAAFYTRSYVDTHTIKSTDSQISAILRVNYGSAATPVAPSVTWSNCSSFPISIGNTDARLSRTISVQNASINDVTKVGITLYNGTGTTKLASKTEKPTPKDGVINAYYNINEELSYTLTKNTQYTYRFEATIDGTTYYSPYYTFTTGPNQGYTVTFNANGGSCSTTSKKVANGAQYGSLPTPTKTYYTFNGWYTTSTGGTKILSSTVASLSGNQTLYAHWTHVCASGHDYVNGVCQRCGDELPAASLFRVRVSGDNRYETAIEVAKELKSTTKQTAFSAVIIACGNDFADALAGSYLATVKNAPILLSWGKGGRFAYLDENNIQYIRENLASTGTVYILGGTDVVPSSYDQALSQFRVCRLGGNNRYETNHLILQEAGVAQGAEVLVCTGSSFPDSLSASAVGKPILLVGEYKGKIYGMDSTFMSSLRNCSYTIIGGTAAVSSRVESALKSYGSVRRLAGDNRFETSVKVAQEYFSDPQAVVVAYAGDYPDGLCGGVLGYATNAPLILTMPGYTSAAANYISQNKIDSGYVLGDEDLIDWDCFGSLFR